MSYPSNSAPEKAVSEHNVPTSPRRCVQCQVFLEGRDADPHELCIFCRPCTPDNTCVWDLCWPKERWSALLAKRQRRLTAKMLAKSHKTSDRVNSNGGKKAGKGKTSKSLDSPSSASSKERKSGLGRSSSVPRSMSQKSDKVVSVKEHPVKVAKQSSTKIRLPATASLTLPKTATASFEEFSTERGIHEIPPSSNSGKGTPPTGAVSQPLVTGWAAESSFPRKGGIGGQEPQTRMEGRGDGERESTDTSRPPTDQINGYNSSIQMSQTRTVGRGDGERESTDPSRPPTDQINGFNSSVQIPQTRMEGRGDGERESTDPSRPLTDLQNGYNPSIQMFQTGMGGRGDGGGVSTDPSRPPTDLIYGFNPSIQMSGEERATADPLDGSASRVAGANGQGVSRLTKRAVRSHIRLPPPAKPAPVQGQRVSTAPLYETARPLITSHTGLQMDPPQVEHSTAQGHSRPAWMEQEAVREAVLASLRDPQVMAAMAQMAPPSYHPSVAQPQQGFKRPYDLAFNSTSQGGSQVMESETEGYEEEYDEEGEDEEENYEEEEEDYGEYGTDEYQEEAEHIVSPPIQVFPPQEPFQARVDPLPGCAGEEGSFRGSSSRAPSVASYATTGSWVEPAPAGVLRSQIDYLSPGVAGPYIAKVLNDAGQPVVYDPDAYAAPPSGDLGFSNPANFKRFKQVRPIPLVPVSATVRFLVGKVQTRAVNKDSVARDPLVGKIMQGQKQDDDILVTPKCPESCFRQMEADTSSRCVPIQPVPSGVEGDAARKKTSPFRVAPWNRDKDSEMRRFEDIARDGLKVANLQTFVMAHLLRALTDDSFTVSQEERLQTLETLKELQHLSTRHLAMLCSQSVISRRACAASALNFPDRTALTGAPFGASLFGDNWESMLQTELSRRQAVAQEVALRGASRGRGKKRQRSRGSGQRGQRGSARGYPTRGAPSASPSARGRGRGAAPMAAGAPGVQASFYEYAGYELPEGSFPQAPPRGRGTRGGPRGRRARGGRAARGRGRGNRRGAGAGASAGGFQAFA